MAYEDYHVNADDVKLDGDPNIRRTVQPSPSSSGGIAYGTCTTAAATAAKVVILSDATGWKLKQGASVAVKFSNTNTFSATAQDPVTLNVNNTGAKNIYYGGSANPTRTNTTAFGRANYVNTYVYDGTYWVWAGSSSDNNTTYSAMSTSELTTGTSTTSRVVRADYLKSAILDLANPIGTVIESTTCDTMAKVIEAYGGTTWIQHEGYILRGASSGVTANDNSNSGTGFGGSDTVTLTGAQSGLKGHGHGFTQPTVNGGATNTGYISADHVHRASNTNNSKAASTTTASASPWYANGAWGYVRNENLYDTWTSGVSANHYHSQVAHTHSVSGGAVSDAASANATSSHSVVQRYKNIYIWERIE